MSDEVKATRVLAEAVCFARNMGALKLGVQHTAWTVADNLLWSLRNDGYELVPVKPESEEPT